MAQPVLVFGWGNPGRGDDALGPALIERLEAARPRHPEWGGLTLLTDFQLQPEHALDLEGHARVILVDASTSCEAPYAFSRLDPLAREIYEVTLRANEAGLGAVKAGAIGSQVDEVARTVIRDAGYGDNFGHGLGHGVGLEIHEAPRLGPSSKDELMAGEIVTVEPGIYISGATGVRIEDLVVVGENGVDRNLSTVTKALTFV